MHILYEDNHIIAVNKSSSEIVQGDKTGDKPLVESVKEYLKERYQKKRKCLLRCSASPRPPRIGCGHFRQDIESSRTPQ